MMVIVEQFVEWILAGETEVLGENLPQRHFVLHKIPRDQTRARPRAAAVRSQWLTAWAMARPLLSVQYDGEHCYRPLRQLCLFWSIGSLILWNLKYYYYELIIRDEMGGTQW
jgi:hypothetical protein